MPQTAAETRANTVEAIEKCIRERARYSLGQEWEDLVPAEYFTSVALAMRDRMVDRMLATERRYQKAGAKRLYYLSLEFLMGRSLTNNLHNLGLLDVCREALAAMGVDVEEVREKEIDAALGNGGLGRLAACFLDSLATLDMPGYGYGIHYEYGLFRQVIENGYQVERPDNWLAHGAPWEIERPDESCVVPVYGRIEHGVDRKGGYNPMWMDWRVLVGVPHDMPIVGFGEETVNYLRLYSARSSHEFDMKIFNDGDYLKAVQQKISSETISKVLYPSDLVEAGRELRLVQEYFLVACALRDIVGRYLKQHHDKDNPTFEDFPSKVAIQLNDTHPSLAVAELMRILVDEHDLWWERAWEITTATLGYTNHTLMPEALERWPVALFEHVLPRHLQIIFEINRKFLDQVATHYPGDLERIRRMSIIEEGNSKQIRMAHLAICGSHSVNGVSEIHTELVKNSLVPDFYQLWPERFNNKTNGVTQRRWLLNANPDLAELIRKTIGTKWITDLDCLRALESCSEDPSFQLEFTAVKRSNKEKLAAVIRETTHVKVDPASLFDVQTKRIHLYKRQLLNVMHIIYEYLCLVEDGQEPIVPRTYVFAGKAAPGYWAAKQVIKLIHSVGQVVNNDRRTRGLLKVVFIPDYRVTLAEKIIPAADLSEQISTAGTEASGTGNMKFAINGALTMGTLDGANIEIREEVGAENIFIFGLKTPEVEAMLKENAYHPTDYYQNDPRVRRVVDTFTSHLFCTRDPGLFDWIAEMLLKPGEQYLHLADLGDYLDAQEEAGREYLKPTQWAQKAILNVARSGKFSSDRTIRDYAREVWGLESVPVAIG